MRTERPASPFANQESISGERSSFGARHQWHQWHQVVSCHRCVTGVSQVCHRSQVFRVLLAGATVVIRENDMLTLSDPPIAVLRVQLRFMEATVAAQQWMTC